MKKFCFVFFTILIISDTYAFTETDTLNTENTVFITDSAVANVQTDSINAVQTKSKRPKVGLVLSGGGAKGMAHIGILKELEEVGIYPDYITGTSMGSIIGALYSIGYSIEELEDFARNTKWLELMSNTLDQKQISIDQKDDLGWYPIEFTFEDGKPVMSSGVIEGQNLSQFFSRLTWCTAGINKFDDYPIPFRCYGVDILKGRLIEFSEGNLAQAIRGSMAIPLVFSPVVIETESDTMMIVDGGVMHNFPVDDVRAMGADIVIGAYTGYEDSVSVNEMNSIAKITGRVLMFGGVTDSKQQIEHVDYLIAPDMHGVQPSDFLQADKIIKRGEESAKLHHSELKRLADSLNSIEPHKRPAPLVRHDSILIGKVVINGINITDEENAYGIIDIKDNQYVTVSTIEDATTRLYATLLYSSINYRIETNENGKIDLIYTVKEKGQSQFKFAYYYDNIYNIGFTLKYERRNLWNKKYSTSIYANINRHPGFHAQLNRSASRDNTLSLSTKLEVHFDFKYAYNKNKKLGDYKYNHFCWDVIGLNKTLNTHTKMGLSAFYEVFATKIDKDTYSGLTNNDEQTSQPGLRFYAKHNSYDDNLYPKHGSKWHAELKGAFGSKRKITDDENEPAVDSVIRHTNYMKISFNYESAYTFGNNTTSLLPSAYIGIATNDIQSADMFYIGGYKYNLRYGQTPFVGFQLNHICDRNFGSVGITFRQEFFKYANLILKANAVATYHSLKDIVDDGPTCKSIGIGAGFLVRTPIGQISFFRANDTYVEKGYYYLSVGFNLPYLQ